MSAPEKPRWIALRPTWVGTGKAALDGMWSFPGLRWSNCDVSDPKPWPETQPFVEGMHAEICSTALHQHVVAVSCPCMSQCGQHHSRAMTAAS